MMSTNVSLTKHRVGHECVYVGTPKGDVGFVFKVLSAQLGNVYLQNAFYNPRGVVLLFVKPGWWGGGGGTILLSLLQWPQGRLTLPPE